MKEGDSPALRPEPEPTEEPRSEEDPEAWRTEIRIDRWQRGDETAFDELYARFAPLLERRIGRSRLWPILASRFELNDVVQETWFAVHRSRSSFTHRGRGSFIAWVGKIADTTLLELLRRKSALKRGGGEESESLDERAVTIPELPAAETPTSNARVGELIEIARDVLSDDEYLAWELVELRGYSSAEAGLALDRTSSSVRGLLLRARTRLVKWMRERENG